MANVRIPNYWREKVKYILGENDRMPVKQIRPRLEAHAEELRENGDAEAKALSKDVPSARTINRIRDEWKEIDPSERVQYQRFYWPESMQGGALPWEASTAALELLMFLDCNGVRTRPPIRLVKWYWIVTRASCDMSRDARFGIAVLLTQQEEKGQTAGDRGAEWYMAYHHFPQAKDQDDPLEGRRKRYHEAIEREDSPIPPYVRGGLSISTTGETDARFWIDLLFRSMGVPRAGREA